jgi:hypothetical protein
MRPRCTGDLEPRGRSGAESVRRPEPTGGSGGERFPPHLGYLSRRDRRSARSSEAFFSGRAAPEADSPFRRPRRETSPREERRPPERALRCMAPGRIRGSHAVLGSGHARTINNERPEGNRRPRPRGPHRGGGNQLTSSPENPGRSRISAPRLLFLRSPSAVFTDSLPCTCPHNAPRNPRRASTGSDLPRAPRPPAGSRGC